jgi:hypothetical protein
MSGISRDECENLICLGLVVLPEGTDFIDLWKWIISPIVLTEAENRIVQGFFSRLTQVVNYLTAASGPTATSQKWGILPWSDFGVLNNETK